jgi:hypothetical protein
MAGRLDRGLAHSLVLTDTVRDLLEATKDLPKAPVSMAEVSRGVAGARPLPVLLSLEFSGDPSQGRSELGLNGFWRRASA